MTDLRKSDVTLPFKEMYNGTFPFQMCVKIWYMKFTIIVFTKLLPSVKGELIEY